uniref:Uncharacterized protein n=1 Tax=Ixodes ricinus TaxID=34613 RepID=A0A0K8RD12_IXORI
MVRRDVCTRLALLAKTPRSVPASGRAPQSTERARGAGVTSLGQNARAFPTHYCSDRALWCRRRSRDRALGTTWSTTTWSGDFVTRSGPSLALTCGSGRTCSRAGRCSTAQRST